MTKRKYPIRNLLIEIPKILYRNFNLLWLLRLSAPQTFISSPLPSTTNSTRKYTEENFPAPIKTPFPLPGLSLPAQQKSKKLPPKKLEEPSALSAQMKMENDWTGKNTFDFLLLLLLYSAEWTQSKCSDRSIHPSTFSLFLKWEKVQNAASRGRAEWKWIFPSGTWCMLSKCQPIQVSRKNLACHWNICEEKGETIKKSGREELN